MIKIKVLLHFFVVPVLVLFLQLSLSAQVNIKMDSEFSKLPTCVREELLQRINKLVLTIQGEKWDDVYDYYWKQYVDGVNGLNKMTKEQYVVKKAKQPNNIGLKFVSFIPSDFRVVSFEKEKLTVIVDGCGEYEYFGKEKRKERITSTVTAALENNIWYFTDIERKSPCFDCSSKACNFEKSQ